MKIARAIILFASIFVIPCSRGADAISEVVSHPFVGVTLIDRSQALPRPCRFHVVILDLKAPGLRFKLTGPGGVRETMIQTTLSFLAQQHAQLAINAHFYLPFPPVDSDTELVGFAASEGVVVSPFEPQPVSSNYFDQGYAIVPFAPAINIDKSNHATMAHLDPSFPDRKHVLEGVQIWTAFSGSAQIISNGVITIPTYSATPAALKPFYGYSDTNSWYAALRARTVAGISQNSSVILLAVEEGIGLPGLTVFEAAQLLRDDFGVYNAINLDGDGSTSLVIADPPTNLPRSLVPPEQSIFAPRPVGSNLAIFALSYPQPDSLCVSRTENGGLMCYWRGQAGWRLERSLALDSNGWEQIPGEIAIDDLYVIEMQPATSLQFFRLAR